MFTLPKSLFGMDKHVLRNGILIGWFGLPNYSFGGQCSSHSGEPKSRTFAPSVEKWHENVDKKDDNKKSNDLG